MSIFVKVFVNICKHGDPLLWTRSAGRRNSAATLFAGAFFTARSRAQTSDGRPELCQSEMAGVLAAINSAKRGSLRNAENSTSLYTFLRSLYPSSIAFFKYCSERSATPILA